MNPVANLVSLITIGGVLIALVSFVLGNSKSEGAKRARIYTRIDECKAEISETYQRKDICTIHQKNTSDKLLKLDKTQDKMNDKIDKLLRKNGINA